MIKRLKYKFIAIIMGVLSIVFIAIFIALNVFMQVKSSEQTGKLLELIAEEDGVEFLHEFRAENFKDNRPPPNSQDDKNPYDLPPAARAARFFYVKTDKSGNIIDSHLDMIDGLLSEDSITYVKSALEKNKSESTIDNFQYLIEDKDYGKIIVFAEKSIESQLLNQLIDISLYVAAFSSVILLVVSIFLSNWAVEPVKIAFDKQRQFVSDASHELKTPLTIISTNVDVLENEIGQNKRLKDIRGQTYRMNILIKDLLSLAKTDEGKTDVEFKEFNISKSILNTALEFESRAYEEEKQLEIDVEPNIFYNGNENQIKQLASILIDNAIKHSKSNGEIKVSFKKVGSKIHLSVYNTGIGIPESERAKVFERFYRSDNSRSRDTGGYGLGLSIAKSIVDTHKGKISISGSEENWIEFNVTL
ncbi:His Kinase A (phospho-acceptor) domain-containing protein [Anaerosphaera aminiphila DSM 21120]|uniref:histidine kinase n=1 Tax=Anaerosphaera aminiphila DSM 21120 TaxID=1120995 RepID=A0A1M5SU51_9FIRM|nr:HAMP domain-containing sensor histidine kinase [Anaerosphaera aminiphila]SHH42010.1 His Kinase A (phospho-acceptor) domain-containing protein [Anaerosphaera aminiphila DSM 21120]